MPGTTLLALRILMSTEVARAICLGDFFMAPEPEKAKILWDAGIYDASVTFFTVDQRLDEATARKLALGAASNETRSFSFGNCPADKNADLKKTEKTWLALFTAPAAAKISGSDLKIDGSSTYCTETSLRWVGTSGPSRDLTWKLPTQDGVATFTCGHDQPGAKTSDLGPELWFSIPTGKGPAINAPHQELLGKTTDPEKSFVFWINSVRAEEKKLPLEIVDVKSGLHGFPDLMSKSTPFHDRNALRSLKKLGRKKLGLELTGENRVVAATLTDAAWLFWNSPRHRDLLLDTSSTHALIQSNTKKGIVMSVVLFSK